MSRSTNLKTTKIRSNINTRLDRDETDVEESFISSKSFKSKGKNKYSPAPDSIVEETILNDVEDDGNDENTSSLIKQNPAKRGILTLILFDLDETLVHTAKEDDPKLQRKAKREAEDRYYEFMLDEELYWGVVRPHVERMIKTAFREADVVGVWTAGTNDYAKEIVKRVFPESFHPHFLWSREQCLFVRGEYIKPLERVYSEFPDIDRENSILFDDKKVVAKYNPDNLAQIPAYSPKDPTSKDNAMTAGAAIIRNMMRTKERRGISLKEQNKSNLRWDA